MKVRKVEQCIALLEIFNHSLTLAIEGEDDEFVKDSLRRTTELQIHLEEKVKAYAGPAPLSVLLQRE